MSRLVVDASVAVKWLSQEPETALANAVFVKHSLTAPDFLVVECANILWKKNRRGEFALGGYEEALLELEALVVDLKPMRDFIALAGKFARDLDHPAYDCAYLALAADEGAPLVTADMSLIRKLTAARFNEAQVLTLDEAADLAI